MRAIIIDDEEKARNMLRSLIIEYCFEVTIVAECNNVPTGVAAINEHKPDVIFLDIDMPSYNGFQLLEFFKDIDFEIIFVTAYSEYAMQAFRVSALDFLQKPVDIDLLITAIEKVKKAKGKSSINAQLNVLRENLEATTIKKIALPVADGILFINVADIIYLQAERAYTQIALQNGQKIIASKNIKEFEEILAGNKNFFRSHRSHIINLNHATRYLKTDGSFIEMSDGTLVMLSKDLKETFIELMKNF
jgi:two-component system LytT family response regulator